MDEGRAGAAPQVQHREAFFPAGKILLSTQGGGEAEPGVRDAAALRWEGAQEGFRPPTGYFQANSVRFIRQKLPEKAFF